MSKNIKLKSLIKENIFDILNVKQVVDDIKNGINAPFVKVYYSTLGGENNVSILLTISLDKKDEFPNNILENSRYAKFRIDNAGIIELISKNYTIQTKFRKTRVTSTVDVINKINKYIQQIQLEKNK